MLTCGRCQQEFPLYEINLFIQHKVSRCNKENVEPCSDDSMEAVLEGASNGDLDGVTPERSSGKFVSIEVSESCGKNLREIFNNKDSLERLIRNELPGKTREEGHTMSDVIGKADSSTSDSNLRVDAETNTVCSGEKSLQNLVAIYTNISTSTWF